MFDFFIKSATKDGFGMGSECQKEFTLHSFSHFYIASGVAWVSWSKFISIFLFFISSKVPILLLSLWSQLTFSFVMFSCLFDNCRMSYV